MHGIYYQTLSQEEPAQQSAARLTPPWYILIDMNHPKYVDVIRVTNLRLNEIRHAYRPDVVE